MIFSNFDDLIDFYTKIIILISNYKFKLNGRQFTKLHLEPKSAKYAWRWSSCNEV